MFKRAYLFAKDYFSEVRPAWWLARSRDCDRYGGHQWSKAERDEVLGSLCRTCSRCKTIESLPSVYSTAGVTTGVTATSTTGCSIRIYP
jgi:hypothetical protein